MCSTNLYAARDDHTGRFFSIIANIHRFRIHYLKFGSKFLRFKRIDIQIV